MYNRFSSSDGELYKDVEGVLEGLCNAIGLWHGHSGQFLAEEALARGLLQLWDGICCLLSVQAKPHHWLQQLLKALKVFTPEARSTAGDWVVVRSCLPAMAHIDFNCPQPHCCGSQLRQFPLISQITLSWQLWKARRQRLHRYYHKYFHRALLCAAQVMIEASLAGLSS